MAKFSVEGDEDVNEEGPCSNRRLPKKPKRASASTSNSGDLAAAAAAAAKDGKPASTSAAPQIPLVRGDVPAPLSLTLTDPDVLDCAICFEPLNPPVYQCENGHIACASCCVNMKNKCASCSWPIGYNRCRAIEKVLESVRISCPNMQHGCKESLNYSKKLDHEKTCIYVPCSCPHPDCTYIGLSYCVYTHFARQHSKSSNQFMFNSALSISLDNNQKHVFLREKVMNTLFVLNRFIEARGSLVNVLCIAPSSSMKKFWYEVGASDGVSSIKLKTVAEMSPRWTGQAPDKKYVLVPNDFVTSGGQLKLELTILREGTPWIEITSDSKVV